MGHCTSVIDHAAKLIAVPVVAARPSRSCRRRLTCLPLGYVVPRGHPVILAPPLKAVSQILSPPMRSILWRSIGLALVLITVLALGLQRLLSWLATSGEVWASAMLGPGFVTTINEMARVI